MLIVYKVRRQPQEPVLLDIDHPPPSPQSAPDASTPHRSPPHDSYNAISTRRPLLNAQTWESPAFLKRSQFKSSYDLFAPEEDEEVSENDRRKRSKFGRGSGQWRFADRTPSPEKILDLDEFEVASPSRPQNEERAICDTGLPELQRLQKIEDRAEVNVEEQGIREPIEDAKGEAKIHGEFNEVGRRVHEVGGDVVDKAASKAPPSPPSTTAELSEAEASKEATPMNEAAPSSPLSIYSVSASSESDQELESEEEEESELDDYDGAAFSGPTSDYGFDGSVYSRTQYPPKERLGIEPAIEEAERMGIGNGVDRSSEQQALSQSVNDSGQERQRNEDERITIQESAHEFQILDGDDPLQTFEHGAVEQDTQDLSSVPPSPSDQPREQQIWTRPFSDAAMMLANAEFQPLQPEETAAEINERASSVEEPKHMELDLAEAQETKKSGTELATQPSEARVSKVEIIDLESDDDQEDVAQGISQQPGRSPSASVNSDVPVAENLAHHSDPSTPVGLPPLDEPPPLRSCTPSPSIAEDSRHAVPQPDLATGKPLAPNEAQSPASTNSSLSIIEYVRDATLQSKLDVQLSSFQEEPASSTAWGQLPRIEERDSSHHGARDARTDRSGLEVGAEETSLLDEPAEAKPQKEISSEAEQVSSPQSTSVEVSPLSVVTRAESQISLEELPATVQDSARVPSSLSQLLTPVTTQQTSFASQPSFNLLPSISDDDTLLTPRLTQDNSADLVVPIALQLPREPSAARSPPHLVKHELAAEKQRSPEKASVPQRPPTLIEKLKAMKRLSNQTPQKRGDTNAISPWFAPKTSSIIVPDSEAESEIESLSEGDWKSIRQDVTAKLQTPEKQKLLAKSFIRSPSHWESIHSIASSPGYHPPSQPPPPGFRTSLSYFVPLATLQSHFTLAVDILAIVLGATLVARATLGPRDYNQTIYITDPSSSLLRSPIVAAQIFRSHNSCFPVVEEGDALLLRDFKVQSFQRQLALLSTQSSAWAVFCRDTGVQVRGPPVEFGAEERGFARGLWRWWAGLDREVKDGLCDGAPKDKKGKPIPLDNKPNGRVFSNEKRLNDNKDKSDVKIKKEGIAGLGVDLPGSQENTRRPSKRGKSPELEIDLSSSQGETRKASLKERSLGLDGVLESTEPPKRVLRPRGARGMAERFETAMTTSNRRSGIVFTSGLGEPESD